MSTWSSNKPAAISLSADSLTAWSTVDLAEVNILSADGKSTGKHYVELRFIGAVLGNGIFGLAESGMTQLTYTGAPATNSIGWSYGGTIYGGAYTAAFVGSWAAGAVLCFAVDADTKKVWVRINGGAWSNAGDPVAGTGQVSTMSGTIHVCATPYRLGSETSIAVKLQALASDFSFAPPTGFAPWVIPPTVGNLVAPVVSVNAYVLAQSITVDGSFVPAVVSITAQAVAVAPITASGGFIVPVVSVNAYVLAQPVAVDCSFIAPVVSVDTYVIARPIAVDGSFIPPVASVNAYVLAKPIAVDCSFIAPIANVTAQGVATTIAWGNFVATTAVVAQGVATTVSWGNFVSALTNINWPYAISANATINAYVRSTEIVTGRVVPAQPIASASATVFTSSIAGTYTPKPISLAGEFGFAAKIEAPLPKLTAVGLNHVQIHGKIQPAVSVLESSCTRWLTVVADLHQPKSSVSSVLSTSLLCDGLVVQVTPTIKASMVQKTVYHAALKSGRVAIRSSMTLPLDYYVIKYRKS